MTTIALAGNPNAGKSTIFNALTGSNQHVGNWHGKTVEKKEGRLRVAHQDIAIVDLPGTYSLTAYSMEEIIARDFIIHEQPDAVVAVVDAGNLERNLYLVLQLLEIGTPLILALNMTDIAEKRGIKIDTATLSKRLGGIPVIRMIGVREMGIDELKAAITHTPIPPAPFWVPLPAVMEQEISRLTALIQQDHTLSQRYAPRWLAIKLLERDQDIATKLAAHSPLIVAAEAAAHRIENALGDEPDTLIAANRYDFIASWITTVITRPAHTTLTRSDKLDRILTHRLWGMPIFFALMWLVFQITANVSAPFLDWIDAVINGAITRWATSLLAVPALDDTWLGALIVNGIIPGVGGVLVFVPVLVSLYLTIAVLEDSGYMARAAFVMDGAMYSLGLQGKSFLPLLVGFGCTVPAVYATRTVENATDRKITAFLTTFMSCGARLPVYILFGAVFFRESSLFIFAMYLLGIGVAMLTSLLLTRLVYRNHVNTPFVMELPPYRLPNLKVIWRSTWQRTTGFIRNAGTTILAASIMIWLLMAIPAQRGEKFNQVAAEDSLLATVSGVIAPVFEPAGFGEWEASGSLITGFAAKEVVIATMNQIYVGASDEPENEPTTFGEDVGEIGTSFADASVLTVQEVVNIAPRTANLIPGVNLAEADFLGTGAAASDDSQLRSALKANFTPLAAVAFNVFILLYVPCMAAVGAMRHEFGWHWTLAQVAYTLFVAWFAAVLVYQLGTLLGV